MWKSSPWQSVCTPLRVHVCDYDPKCIACQLTRSHVQGMHASESPYSLCRNAVVLEEDESFVKTPAWKRLTPLQKLAQKLGESLPETCKLHPALEVYVVDEHDPLQRAGLIGELGVRVCTPRAPCPPVFACQSTKNSTIKLVKSHVNADSLSTVQVRSE